MQNISKQCDIINGRLTNCFSLKDYVLKYMFMPVMSPTVEPIGMGPILTPLKEENEKDPTRNNFKVAHNFDCSVEAPGHMTYMETGNLVFEKIPYAI